MGWILTRSATPSAALVLEQNARLKFQILTFCGALSHTQPICKTEFQANSTGWGVALRVRTQGGRFRGFFARRPERRDPAAASGRSQFRLRSRARAFGPRQRRNGLRPRARPQTLRRAAQKSTEFCDENSLQLSDLARFLIVRTIPFEGQAREITPLSGGKAHLPAGRSRPKLQVIRAAPPSVSRQKAPPMRSVREGRPSGRQRAAGMGGRHGA
jgi:hypothetical protein